MLNGQLCEFWMIIRHQQIVLNIGLLYRNFKAAYLM